MMEIFQSFENVEELKHRWIAKRLVRMVSRDKLGHRGSQPEGHQAHHLLRSLTISSASRGNIPERFD